MAFGRLERRSAARPFAEINMTPLIDVMLVLLVIFLVAAPLMTRRLKLDLPSAEGASPSDASAVVSVAVSADGALHWGDEPVPAELLAARVAEAARRDPTTEVQLRADEAVPYGRIAELIGLVQRAGLSHIGFVTERAQPGR